MKERRRRAADRYIDVGGDTMFKEHAWMRRSMRISTVGFSCQPFPLPVPPAHLTSKFTFTHGPEVEFGDISVPAPDSVDILALFALFHRPQLAPTGAAGLPR